MYERRYPVWRNRNQSGSPTPWNAATGQHIEDGLVEVSAKADAAEAELEGRLSEAELSNTIGEVAGAQISTPGTDAHAAVEAVVTPAVAVAVPSSSSVASLTTSLRQRTKFIGPTDLAMFAFANLNGVASSAHWSIDASDVLTHASNAEEQDDTALILGTTLMDGRIGAQVYTTLDASASPPRYGGVIIRRYANGAMLFAVVRDGISGGPTRQVALWSSSGAAWVDGGTPPYTNISGWITLSGAGQTPPDGPAWTDLEVEMVANRVRIFVAGQQVNETVVATSWLRPGRVGLLAKAAGTIARKFKNVRVVEYDWRVVKPNTLKVLALGTSITNAIGATSSANGYRAKLEGYLRASLMRPDVTVVNGGVGGDTSAMMLARLPALLSTHTPGMVLIETSINSARLDIGETPDTAAANMREMVALVKRAGAIPVVMTSLPINPATFGNLSWWDTASHAIAREMDGNTRRISAEQNVALIDWYSAYNGLNSATYLADGIHPNNAGHDLIATTIRDVLTQARYR